MSQHTVVPLTGKNEMLILSMTCMRLGTHDESIRMMLDGHFSEAVRLGMTRLGKGVTPQSADEHAVMGQVIGRALIALGREAEAEDLFRHQLRTYELGARGRTRWMASLDQGAMQTALNRMSRAASLFNAVADDETASVILRIEALAGLAGCMRRLGEYRRSERTLVHAQSLASEQSESVKRLLEALRLETIVLSRLCAFDEDIDAAPAFSNSQSMALDGDELHARLVEAAQDLAGTPIAQQRLHFLAALMDPKIRGASLDASITDCINTIREQKLLGYERECRIEAALSTVARGDGKSPRELLAGLLHDEQTIRRHRYSLELKYCLSRIYALQGRHADALRLYKEHAAQALSRLRSELTQLPYSRCLEKQELAEHADAMQLQLPLRYRRAYQYILEHLDNHDLSVREVAQHIDVTERSLQTTFRSYLGIAPAELIRRKRMEGIRKELREAPERPGVLDVGQRWGLANRATLRKNYRQVFNETPTTVLRENAVVGAKAAEVVTGESRGTSGI